MKTSSHLLFGYGLAHHGANPVAVSQAVLAVVSRGFGQRIAKEMLGGAAGTAPVNWLWSTSNSLRLVNPVNAGIEPVNLLWLKANAPRLVNPASAGIEPVRLLPLTLKLKTLVNAVSAGRVPVRLLDGKSKSVTWLGVPVES